MAGACRDDLPEGRNGIFLREGLDWGNQPELLQQIRFYAQAPGTRFHYANYFLHRSIASTAPIAAFWQNACAGNDR
jgi:hypothetical protein